MRRRALGGSLGVVLLLAGSAAALPPSAPGRAPAGERGEDLDRLLDKLDRDERAMRDELATTGPRLAATQRLVVARGRVYYRYVHAGLLPAGGGFDAIVDHAARVERARLALERDLATEASLKKRKVELEARIERLRAERAPLDVQREAMQRARQALREVDERHAAFERAFASSTRPPDYVAVYGASTGPTEADPRAGFRQLQGRLPFPVAGRAEVRRVSRRGAGGPGIELVGAVGASVRSVAAGRVAFADTYDDYGLTVILDHGDHYFSVYGGLASADVRVGDAIAQGARVGAMGGSGGHGLVYFELRHDAETIDPGPWLGM
jgi:murein DD-endopeptidase MepM/ murein hydrolase activator NlpD